MSIFQYRISWKFVNYLNFAVSNFMKIYYLNFPVSNFMKICSLSLFCSIELHESLSIISILQYRILWKFNYLHFPVSNTMKICSLSPFCSIELHESLFIISIFQYRISRKYVHCFLKLLSDIIEDTDVPYAMRSFFLASFGWNGAKNGWIWRSLHKIYRDFVKVC